MKTESDVKESLTTADSERVGVDDRRLVVCRSTSILRQMIAAQINAKAFAGETVARMIAKGASGQVMRRRGIPQSVFHWVFGSIAWESMSVDEAAVECLSMYRRDYVFAHNGRGPTAGG